MVSEVSEASHRWSCAALTVLAALAPFNVKLTAEPWTDLQLRLLVVLALVTVVVIAVRGLKTPQWHWPDVTDSLAYGWLLMVWLSALLSDDIVLGSGGAIRMSVAALLIPATRSVAKSRSDARRLLQGVALGTTAGALIGLLVWATAAETGVMEIFVGRVTRLGPFDRLTRPWSHANVAAMAMGASVAALAVVRRAWLRSAALLLVIVAMVLTVSRGGLLALAAAGLVWILLRRNRVEALQVGLLVVVAAGVFVVSDAWTSRSEQLGDEAFYASSIDVPASFTVDGSDEFVQVSVTNDSASTWPRVGEDRVLISARWLGEDNLIWTEDWWELPQDLAPGESVTTGLSVAARLPVGTYAVRWDLIIPNTAYFGQFLGKDPVINHGLIVSSYVTLDDVFRYELVERSIGVGRVDGWKLAWDDFTSSPALGVGPNQFGQQADGRFAPDQRSVGSHAHNLVLEPLATWGLLGTLPFLALGLGALWRTVTAAWRTRDTMATVVAVGLIAVVVHGMVDWPLVTITNGIPVGVLVGLAWSRAIGSEAIGGRS